MVFDIAYRCRICILALASGYVFRVDAIHEEAGMRRWYTGTLMP